MNGVPRGPEPDAPRAPSTEPERVGALEARFGRVERLGGGRHSRVYLAGGLVVKAYREAIGMHLLEAEKMDRAGLGELVLETLELDGLELLVMPRFDGRPVGAADVPRAAPALARFLRGLHAREHGRDVDLEVVRAKLERFAPTLPDPRLAPLFGAVERALAAGALEAPARLCHLDLWCANILLADDGRVLVVDWARSDWDDPARDVAILKTGTLDQLPPAPAVELALEVAGDHRARLPAYVALQTLHDLHWFLEREPDGYAAAFDAKAPRALELAGA